MSKGTLATITVMGRVGKDAEIRSLANGKAMTSISIATTHSRKGKNGYEDVTTWFRATIFGQPEYLSRFVKGSIACVSGTFYDNVWTDQQGAQHHQPSIDCSEAMIVGSSSGQAGYSSGGGGGGAFQSKHDPQRTGHHSHSVNSNDLNDFDDDCPF